MEHKVNALETPSPRWFSIYAAGSLIAERVITLSRRKYKPWLLWMCVSEMWFWSQLGRNCISVKLSENAPIGSAWGTFLWLFLSHSYLWYSQKGDWTLHPRPLKVAGSFLSCYWCGSAYRSSPSCWMEKQVPYGM